jgi:hypothetical protein
LRDVGRIIWGEAMAAGGGEDEALIAGDEIFPGTLVTSATGSDQLPVGIRHGTMARKRVVRYIEMGHG